MLSERFKIALVRGRLQGLRQYELAVAVGLHPNTLSAILHGARRVTPDDIRIIRIGAKLGLKPAECFDSEQQDKAS
jgi:plasmid maintenance system antidote protein VapI